MVVFENLNKSISSIRNTLLKSRHTCCLKENKGLLTAAIVGDHRAIRGLGQCPDADINVVDSKGRTPLYLASLLGHVKAIEEILNLENISYNRGRDIDGMTPFAIAAKKGYKEIMTLLTNYPNKKDEDVNKGWQSDEWTSQYGRNDFENAPTPKPTSSSTELLSGCQISQQILNENSLLTFYILGEISCLADTFNCTNGSPTCIPNSWVCDGHNECHDGSDENRDLCGEKLFFLYSYRFLITNFIFLKLNGNVRRTNSHVKMVIHCAFHNRELAT